ncbi:MAG: pyruvate kinase [Alphaproteobacteria bacterium 16-39-46]|nr:MAG: pyruvate kinase [Alphaproteobacteria bacterium 16-39-46]OZA41667.1 MAG: pyruvate kinase [Alphaproteobacteria bacterium 17-39-52]HQS84752.1 pyruvate kinase [Alphaproteobacteria bacterium]HQS94564.1 pyruvate kinase [Alphaproteobacteria bacterium]
MDQKKFLCHAKIVATLGPSSSQYEEIRDLALKGVDVFRLNFSHGNYEDHQKRFDIIRLLEKELGRPFGIFMDLQGPKLRVGVFEKGSVSLKKGNSFRLDLEDSPGNEKRAFLPHPEIFKALRKDAILLMVDGKIRLKVLSHGSDFANVEILTSGLLSDRQGVNVPGVKLPISALTEKDLKDLEVGLKMGVDWVALSFIQTPEDVYEASQIIRGRAGIIAKIEKPLAVEHVKEIIDLSDAVMVARGDLGVEMNAEEVPSIQKRIISIAKQSGKPVIVATQMLESMIHCPTPTRAEASDVATAIYDGADAVMLSGESASGEYPREAVEIMQRIIYRVEQDSFYEKFIEANRFLPRATEEDAITGAARQIADTLEVAAIITCTETGATAQRAARERPRAPILGLTPNLNTARRLTLVWGVCSVVTPYVDDIAEMEHLGKTIAKEKGFCQKGGRLVLTAGLPFRTPGATNMLRIIHA